LNENILSSNLRHGKKVNIYLLGR